MSGDDLTKHFFGGFYCALHILHHAVEGSICGVEMTEELGRHGYKLSPGTLYPILHDLTESGYLVSEDDIVGGKRRKNYRATKKGQSLLRDARVKLRELFHEVVDEDGK